MLQLKSGEALELNVSDLAYGGAGVARIEGFVVFVRGALPGDRVLARIGTLKASYAEATVVEVLDPSPRRVKAPCVHFGLCGGCQWMNLEYAAQLAAKEKQVRDCLSRIGRLEGHRVHPIEPSPRTLGYRNKMEFAFAASPAGLVAGLHRADDPSLVEEIRECLLHEPEANDIVSWTVLALRDRGLDAAGRETLRPGISVEGMDDPDPTEESARWAGRPGEEAGRAGRSDRQSGRRGPAREPEQADGEAPAPAPRPAPREEPAQARLRRLIIRRGIDGRYLLVLATSEGDLPGAEALAKSLMSRFAQVSGLVRLAGERPGREGRAITLAGSDTLVEEIAGLRLTASAGSFLQVNHAQAERLYRKVEEFAAAAPGERALDLYCGAGAITLLLARNAARATGVESSPASVLCAERSATDNAVFSCRFIRGDVVRVLASMVYDGQQQDLVVVNPPRAGLAKDVTGSISRLSPSRIVYVSCNPATLARDLARFARLGYRTTDVAPFDMFPHTWHIETVVRMELAPPTSE